MDENRGSSCPLKILTSEILRSVLNDPKLNSNDLTQKSTSVSLYGQLFSRYSTFYDFPLTPMLNFKVS